MTPERAKAIAADNGCQFVIAGPCYWRIQRTADNYGYIDKEHLDICSEEQFVAFYLPDKRD